MQDKDVLIFFRFQKKQGNKFGVGVKNRKNGLCFSLFVNGFDIFLREPVFGV